MALASPRFLFWLGGLAEGMEEGAGLIEGTKSGQPLRREVEGEVQLSLKSSDGKGARAACPAPHDGRPWPLRPRVGKALAQKAQLVSRLCAPGASVFLSSHKGVCWSPWKARLTVGGQRADFFDCLYLPIRDRPSSDWKPTAAAAANMY